jgi:hypothetical protein
MLERGLIILRGRIWSKDLEWAEAEADLLHNIPSLLNESNVNRHKSWWSVERELYIEKLDRLGREEANSKMKTYYAPIWAEMQPIMEGLKSD